MGEAGLIEYIDLHIIVHGVILRLIGEQKKDLQCFATTALQDIVELMMAMHLFLALLVITD